jgi:hypothetical protein
MHITLKTDWESPLPERYLAPLPPAFIPSSDQSTNSGRTDMSGITTGTTGTGSNSGSGTNRTGSRTPDASQPLGMAEKCKPYVEAFAPFRETGKRVREVIKAASAAGHTLPANDAGTDMCISFHVKGICNSACGRKRDHASHNNAETARLTEWCNAAFGL